jgi:hypothetical protein
MKGPLVNPRTGLLCAAAVAALAITGCGGDDNAGDNGTVQATTPAQPDAAAPKPSVTFVKPADGTAAGSKFTAKVKLENFEIDAKSVGKSPVPGKGHLHFTIDGGRYDGPAYSGANGKLAAKLGVDGKYSPSVEPTITYANIPPGKHTLECYLANNNHTPTGAETETEFTVK